MKLLSLLSVLALTFLANSINAQATYSVDPENSRVWVEGTSTLKNWSAEVGKFEGAITSNDDVTVANVNLIFDVKSMDGGRGPDMNAKIYKALKAEEHPVITFSGMGTGPSSAKGVLNLAGKSLDIQVTAGGTVVAGKISGEQALKLSNFDIEPPSAMFGQIVCHDDLTNTYELTLTEK